jgi:hypothetical protein
MTAERRARMRSGEGSRERRIVKIGRGLGMGKDTEMRGLARDLLMRYPRREEEEDEEEDGEDAMIGAYEVVHVYFVDIYTHRECVSTCEGRAAMGAGRSTP